MLLVTIITSVVRIAIHPAALVLLMQVNRTRGQEGKLLDQE